MLEIFNRTVYGAELLLKRAK